MKTKCTLVLVVVALSVCKPNFIAAQVDVQDSSALVALYNSTDGPNWNNHKNWLTSKPIESWYGIYVSSENRVVSIDLYDNNLTGSIPAELGNLTNLLNLDLNHNQLTGSIPFQLGNITRLWQLNLSNNQLSDGIPADLGKFTDMGWLLLNNNQLTGSIPAALGNANMYNLILNNNQLSNTIPSELGNLTNLFRLYLNNNQLSGSIPPELSNLKNLDELYLNNNQLSDSIPAELGNFEDLGKLNLSSNQLSGRIPKELGKLFYLAYLYLDSNQLTGNIPPEISNLQQLYVLHLTDNQLSGNIPARLGKLRVNYLYLDNNQLSGTIPEEFGNDHLQVLSLSHNKLTGQIPAALSKCTYLQKLDLRDNQLTDTVPAFLASLHLKKLHIQFNHFTFDGLEFLAQHNFREFRYGFERKIKVNQSNNTLSVYAGGTLSNNTYKWFNDGALAATINGDSTFTPIGSGNYSVEVTNSIATDLTLKSDTVSFSAFTPIAQNNSAVIKANDKNNFSVYPNPAKANVTVSFNATGNYTLRLTDENGNVLQTKTGVAVNNKNILQLDVCKYAGGVYFVTITKANNEAQTLKLNKQ